MANTWKDAQHLSLLVKCKSKPQSDITSQQSELSSSKSLQTINSWEGVEKKEYSCTVGGNVNWYNHCGRQYGDSLKTRNKITIWPSHPTSGIYLEETKTEKDTCIPLSSAALFTIARTWKPPRCPLTDEWIKECGTYTQWNITQP